MGTVATPAWLAGEKWESEIENPAPRRALLIFLVPKNESLMAIFGIRNIVAMLAGVMLAIIGVVHLSSGLGYGVPTRILIILSMFIPLVSLLALLMLSSKATAVFHHRLQGWASGRCTQSGR